MFRDAQKNRASEKGGALHTGESITTHEHSIRMATALGRAVHVDEVFTQTHIRKGTGEYIDERSRKTIEDFFARLTEARPEGGSGPDGRVDADKEMIKTQCWVDTVRGKKKGRLCGVGQLASHYSAGRGGIFRHQPSTFTTFYPNNVVSKDAYDSLLARFENLVRTLQPCPPLQPPSHTTAMHDEDNDDSDDPDFPHSQNQFLPSIRKISSSFIPSSFADSQSVDEAATGVLRTGRQRSSKRHGGTSFYNSLCFYFVQRFIEFILRHFSGLSSSQSQSCFSSTTNLSSTFGEFPHR
ncbi:hypothetical protein V8G54_028952 [Vigna mungo]|uniref:Uncharacterized protein n=1 Tax=Vigna mungo TaxID=3915 RepID=A0AAQ3MTI9_VIGMU